VGDTSLSTPRITESITQPKSNSANKRLIGLAAASRRLFTGCAFFRLLDEVQRFNRKEPHDDIHLSSSPNIEGKAAPFAHIEKFRVQGSCSITVIGAHSGNHLQRSIKSRASARGKQRTRCLRRAAQTQESISFALVSVHTITVGDSDQPQLPARVPRPPNITGPDQRLLPRWPSRLIETRWTVLRGTSRAASQAHHQRSSLTD